MVGTEQAIQAIIIFASIIPLTLLFLWLGSVLKNICIGIFTVIKALFECVVWHYEQTFRRKRRRLKRYRWK